MATAAADEASKISNGVSADSYARIARREWDICDELKICLARMREVNETCKKPLALWLHSDAIDVDITAPVGNCKNNIDIFRVDYNQLISIIVPSIECLLTDFSAFEQKTSDGGDVKKVTPMMFSAYRLMVRPGRDGTRIFRFRRLFQQLCVDLAAQMEGERLNWIRFNQDKLRADSYRGLFDSIRHNDVLNNTGKKVVLPSSFRFGTVYGPAFPRWNGNCAKTW